MNLWNGETAADATLDRAFGLVEQSRDRSVAVAAQVRELDGAPFGIRELREGAVDGAGDGLRDDLGLDASRWRRCRERVALFACLARRV